MPITINVAAPRMGPFFQGSSLIVSTNYAQNIINTYGQGLTVCSTYPGTYWYQDGATLTVYPYGTRCPGQYPPPEPYPPGPTPYPPYPPGPSCSGEIQVYFTVTLRDPQSGIIYYAGNTYSMLPDRVRRLINNPTWNNVQFVDERGRPVNENRICYYVGTTITVSPLIYAASFNPESAPPVTAVPKMGGVQKKSVRFISQ